jgi:hypothetical protein
LISRRSVLGWLSFLVLGWAAFPAPGATQAWEDYNFRDLEFRGIGVEAGQVWAARVEPTTNYALRLDLGFISTGIRIAPTARFWSSSLASDELDRLSRQIVLVCERQVDVTCPAKLDLGEVRLSDLELAVDAQYLLFVNRRLSPFIGFGAGLHLLNGRGDFVDGTFVEDLLDTVSPGIGPTFGLNLRAASALQFHGEVRFMLASDVRYASFSGGGVWTLPRPAVN